MRFKAAVKYMAICKTHLTGLIRDGKVQGRIVEGLSYVNRQSMDDYLDNAPARKGKGSAA